MNNCDDVPDIIDTTAVSARVQADETTEEGEDICPVQTGIALVEARCKQLEKMHRWKTLVLFLSWHQKVRCLIPRLWQVEKDRVIMICTKHR